MSALRALKVLLVSIPIAIWLWISTPAAMALVPIQLSDLSYHDCPPELSQGMVASGSTLAANCFIVTGTAQNKSGKPVVNADIFGRIYDANNNNIMPNRNRLGSIDEVPSGTSEFDLQISVPTSNPLPLQLKQFKAAGFTGRVRR